MRLRLAWAIQHNCVTNKQTNNFPTKYILAHIQPQIFNSCINPYSSLGHYRHNGFISICKDYPCIIEMLISLSSDLVAL